MSELVENAKLNKVKLVVRNQLPGRKHVLFCCGMKEYELGPNESITIEVEDCDCMYFDGLIEMR